MADLTGKRIDQYRIDQKLGEGGMGAVYRAQDVSLNRTIALKVMSEGFAKMPGAQQRFLQEAQAAARLDHSSIIKIHHFGTTQGLLYMIMAFVPGGSLATYIKQLAANRQVLELKEMLFLLAQVADALSYAHRNGVVHRDVKPDNVLLQKLDEPERTGEPPIRAIVTDFGLAKLREGGMDTTPGTFMGTMAYMSPEQTMGKALDGRSDIYSLGIMLYQLATGQLPFDIKTPTEAVTKHVQETPPSPEVVRPGVPASIVAIIQKSIAKDPNQRYQTATEMATELRQAAAKLSQQEVTRFAAPAAMVSLVTQLQASTPPPLPTTMGDRLPTAGVDQLVISQKGQNPFSFKLEKELIVIGRVAGNDLVLDASGISRQHARLQRTPNGWQITDLGSTNGTFLEGNKLLPDVPESWQAGQTVRMGPYYIMLRPAQQIGRTVAGTMAMGGSPTYQATTPQGSMIGRTQVQSSSGQIGVVVTPTNVDIQPGGRADIQAELLNQGITVDHFMLSLEGVPTSWVTIPQTSLQLMPGSQGSLPISIHPPRDSSATAGLHKYRLTVRATSNPRESAGITGQINLQPFEQYNVIVTPSQLNSGATCRVEIQNQGNSPTTFTVTGSDPAEAIVFQGTGQPIQLNPGQQNSITLQLAAKKRPLLGQTQKLPFTIGATPSGSGAKMSATGTAQRQPGQLNVSPIIPTWLAAILPLLLILLCIGGGFALNAINQERETATQTAQAIIAQATSTGGAIAVQGTAISVAQSTQTALDMLFAQQTATAQQQQANTQATADAGTAAAIGDNDGDGLSNQEEQQFNTDPNNPDTDGDGLNDYQEVRQYATDPNNRDSDADNSSDGQEVSAGTAPRNADTDQDGLPDGLDPDPLHAPTATPPPAPPPTNTHTPTPVPGAWSGLWDSSCSFVACGQLNLTQTDNTVSGSYAAGSGSLNGTVEGNRFTGQWSLGGTNGTFDFWLSDDGSYWQGNWDGTFAWCGYRSGGAQPTPCGIARWYGAWQTTYGTLNVIQIGSEVTGTYADNDGTIEAVAAGTNLTGNWRRSSGSTGAFTFFQDPNSRQFNGNWNSDNAWCGARAGEAQPESCYNAGDWVFDIPDLDIFDLGGFIIVTPPPIIPNPDIFIDPGLIIDPNLFLLPTPTPFLLLIDPVFVLPIPTP